jgi:nitrogen fixation NifU-like protein
LEENMPLYSAKVMDHFTNPRNVGEIEDADGVGEVGNPRCGDIMKIFLKIDNGVIVDAKFKTYGCGAAIATSSMATELIKGKTIKDALKVTNMAVAEALDGLPPIKMHCSVLAQEGIQAAIKDYLSKHEDDPNVDEFNELFTCTGCCSSCGMRDLHGHGDGLEGELEEVVVPDDSGSENKN